MYTARGAQGQRVLGAAETMRPPGSESCERTQTLEDDENIGDGGV